MKSDIFQKLLENRENAVPTLLITDLESGKQTLWTEDAIDGDLQLSPDIWEQCENVLRRGRSTLVTDGDRKIFLQVHNPRKKLFIIGAVHIAQALAPLAQAAHYDVIMIDPRSAWGSAERFPDITIDDRWPDEALKAYGLNRRSAVVTLTHDPKLDDPALEYALNSGVFYIGALGSKKTHAARVERLKQAGFSDDEIGRIKAPVGLDIGAMSPAEIAISILAEMTLELRGAKGR